MPVRVLIVDDHEPIRRGIRSLLTRRQDWIVCGEAADGLEATEMARKIRPDVILMDMSMPRMNGAEATRIIRQEVPEAEVIIVTQNDPTVVRQQAAQVGARGYVSKATLARDLLPAILKIVGGSEDEPPAAATEKEASEGKWLFGGGDLGYLIRVHDWAATPLGPISAWPQSLKTAVNIMLNSQHPMWIGWGTELTFLYNDAYISVLSLAKHPGSLGRPAHEVWPEIWDICGPLAEKVFVKGEPSFLNDVRLFMNRGEYFEETYYSFSYSPIYDESGKVGGLFCPSNETTAKVLHARRLRTLSELSAKALVEKSMESACASSVETISHNADDVPFSLLYLLDDQCSVAKLQGSSHVPEANDRTAPAEIRVGTGRAQMWPIQEVVADSQARLVPLEHRLSLPSGLGNEPVREAIVLPVSSPGQNHPIGVLVAGVNPTRKLDTEYRTFFSLIADQVGTAVQNARAAELEKKRIDALTEIDRAKTQFFSNVSHEFRTPLTLMLGPLEDMLSESEGLAPKQREQLDVAHRNSLRLLKLVNTLLDFSRIEAGRLQANYEPTDLANLTAELASVFRSAIERAGLKLTVECESIGEPVYVDRELWEKIVFNLLSNAFKFTFEGEVRVYLCQRDNSVQLQVSDTGTGIPADELPHLFERFHRVKNARGRTFEGSGIGLALVQELAKLHGGSVRVESQPGRGSTFTVLIPRGKSHLPAERIDRRTEATPARGGAYVEEALSWLPEVASLSFTASAHSLGTALHESSVSRKTRILVADDNADMREYLRHMLGSYEVELVTNGQSAFEAAVKRTPDLILSDVMMPNLDGFGLLRKLRADKRTAGIPVILLSARAGEEARVEGVAAGADDYLVKPFTARELTARIETHLRLSQIRKEAAEREHKLRLEAERNEGRFRAIVETTPECVKLVAADGTILHMNESGLAMLRADRAEAVVGRSAYDLIAPEDRERYLEFNEKICRGEKGSLEFDVIGLQGARRTMETHAAPLRQSDGSVIQLAVSRDITERKQASETLRRHRERFEIVVQASGVGFWFCDLPFDKLIWDARVKEHFWLPPDADVTIETFYERLHPEDRERTRQAIEESNAKGVPYDIEYRTVSPADGREKWIRAIGRTSYDAAGQPKRFDGVTLDVTDKRVASDRERQITSEAIAANAKFKAVFEQTTMFAGIMTRDGTLIEANKLALETCGYRAEEVLGRPFWQTAWWRDLPDSQEKIRIATQRAAQGIPYRETLPYSWADGTQRVVNFALYPIVNDNGEILYLHPTGMDVTELKKAEDNYRNLTERLEAEVRTRTSELEERNSEVLRQSELVRAFSQRLMHAQDEERRHIARELHDSAGQTLTVLGMNIGHLIEKAAASTPEIAADAKKVQASVQQLHNEIRTASYLLHPPLLDEIGLSSALDWYVEGLAERSGMTIRLDISEDFGRLPGDMELIIFRLVQECLTNIHRHSGSKTAAISVVREAEKITVEVRDHGKGMSRERLAEIQSRNSGVGIRGMRERIRQYDGEMRIESSGSGTRILVTIPLRKFAAQTEAGGVESFEATAN